MRHILRENCAKLEINVQSFIPNDKTLDNTLTPPKNTDREV